MFLSLCSQLCGAGSWPSEARLRQHMLSQHGIKPAVATPRSSACAALCAPVRSSPVEPSPLHLAGAAEAEGSRYHVIVLTSLRRRVLAVRSSPATTHAEQARDQAVPGDPAQLCRCSMVFACPHLSCGTQPPRGSTCLCSQNFGAGSLPSEAGLYHFLLNSF